MEPIKQLFHHGAITLTMSMVTRVSGRGSQQSASATRNPERGILLCDKCALSVTEDTQIVRLS